MKIKLDAKTVAGLVLADGQNETFFWDTELEGFGLRLRGRRRRGPLRKFVAQYRVAQRSRRVTIGSADKLTPGQAREAARKILAKVALGHDPQAEREATRQAQARTFKAVVADYLDAKQPQLRPASFRVSKLYLSGPYFRSLHPMAISAVTRTDVAACVRTISRSHSTNTAAAARRALSAFFAWAISDGLLGDGANPVDGSHRPADPEPRDHVLTDVELIKVWRACGDDDYGRIVRLLTLFAAAVRKSAVCGGPNSISTGVSGTCRESEAKINESKLLPCRKRLWPSCRRRPVMTGIACSAFAPQVFRRGPMRRRRSTVVLVTP